MKWALARGRAGALASPIGGQLIASAYVAPAVKFLRVIYVGRPGYGAMYRRASIKWHVYERGRAHHAIEVLRASEKNFQKKVLSTREMKAAQSAASLKRWW